MNLPPGPSGPPRPTTTATTTTTPQHACFYTRARPPATHLQTAHQRRLLLRVQLRPAADEGGGEQLAGHAGVNLGVPGAA